MPEREKPFKESSEEQPPVEAKEPREAYESREEKSSAPLEEKPTLPVPRESVGVSSVDARQEAAKKAEHLEEFNRLVGEFREALGSWNVAQIELIHEQRELQRILDKPLLERIQDFLLSFLSGPDTKAQDAAQLKVNNARELYEVRLQKVKERFAIVRAAQEEVEQSGGEVDGEIKRFLEELQFIDSVEIKP